MSRSRFLAAWAVLLLVGAPGAARCAQIGGLAAPLETGRLAVSAALGYGERDVRVGSEEELRTRRALFRAEFALLDGVAVRGTAGFADAELDRSDFGGTLGGAFGVGLRCRLLAFAEPSAELVLDLGWEGSRSQDGTRSLGSRVYHVASYLVKKVGAAGRTGYFYPYGGVRVSYARFDGTGGLDDGKGEDLAGVFAGVDYFVTPSVYFSGEVHLFDETSLFLGVGYRL